MNKDLTTLGGERNFLGDVVEDTEGYVTGRRLGLIILAKF